jgi:hypothetical protein
VIPCDVSPPVVELTNHVLNYDKGIINVAGSFQPTQPPDSTLDNQPNAIFGLLARHIPPKEVLLLATDT